MKLGKHLSLFCNEFEKFNKTVASVLDSIDHMTLNYFEIKLYWRGNIKFCHFVYNVVIEIYYIMLRNMQITSGFINCIAWCYITSRSNAF